MSELYNKLINENNLLDAYLVAKNEYSRDQRDCEKFRRFIDISLRIADMDMEFEDREKYLTEAYAAWNIFSESVDIDEETLLLIKEYKERIFATREDIFNAAAAFDNDYIKDIENENNNSLAKLQELYEKVEQCTAQKVFDELMAELAEVDNKLEKDYFTDIQDRSYTSLTKNFTALVSRKMEELNYISLVEKNKDAVNCFKYVFEEFNNNKTKYKNVESNLKNLAMNKLFSFDAKELFNETLVYYNYVYAKIFNDISDNLKYKLTEWSIQVAKERK